MFGTTRLKSTPINVHVSESVVLHAREHLTSIWEARNRSGYFFDTALYYALLQKTFREPVHNGRIFLNPYMNLLGLPVSYDLACITTV